MAERVAMAEEIQVIVITPNIPFTEEAELVYDHEDNTDCCQTYVEHPLQCCFLTCFVCVVLFVFVYEVMYLQRQRE